MDSRDDPQPPHRKLQPPPGMLMSHNQYNPNAAAFMDPTSTSQSIHHRLPFGSLAPQQQHHHPQAQPHQKTLGFGDGSPSSLPVRLGLDQNQQQQEVKKKLGRPRKYGPGSRSRTALGVGENAKRTRPFTSRNALEGEDFIPYTIKVKTGEDIALRLMDFLRKGPRSICILSGSGAVFNARIQIKPTETFSLKGYFEIITLSGSFLQQDFNGSITRSGSLTVALAGPEGRSYGGTVVGPLIAATQVQVMVGCFVAEAEQQKEKESSSNNAQGGNPEPPANIGSNSQGASSHLSSENETGSPSMHHDKTNDGFEL